METQRHISAPNTPPSDPTNTQPQTDAQPPTNIQVDSNFTLVFLDEVDSTNRYVLDNADALEHHSVVVSDIQTAGRGRRERNWDSSIRGNLYMSLLEKPFRQQTAGGQASTQAELAVQQSENPREAPAQTRIAVQNFTQLMAVSVVASCRSLGLAGVGIKWPNDIFTAGKKLGGILSESRIAGHRRSGIVIGLGLNIVRAPSIQGAKYEASALNDLLRNYISNETILRSILDHYALRYNAFIEQGFPAISAEFEDALLFKQAPFTYNGRKFQSAGVNERGELLGRNETGGIEAILSADIAWDDTA